MQRQLVSQITKGFDLWLNFVVYRNRPRRLRANQVSISRPCECPLACPLKAERTWKLRKCFFSFFLREKVHESCRLMSSDSVTLSGEITTCGAWNRVMSFSCLRLHVAVARSLVRFLCDLGSCSRILWLPRFSRQSTVCNWRRAVMAFIGHEMFDRGRVVLF